MRQLTERLDGWRDEQIALLERLVNHDSGTDDVMDVNRVGAILAERLRGLGFTLNRVATERFGDHLVAEKPGSGPKRFLFVGHYDTVFPSGTAKARPFHVDRNTEIDIVMIGGMLRGNSTRNRKPRREQPSIIAAS